MPHAKGAKDAKFFSLQILCALRALCVRQNEFLHCQTDADKSTDAAGKTFLDHCVSTPNGTDCRHFGMAE